MHSLEAVKDELVSVLEKHGPSTFLIVAGNQKTGENLFWPSVDMIKGPEEDLKWLLGLLQHSYKSYPGFRELIDLFNIAINVDQMHEQRLRGKHDSG